MCRNERMKSEKTDNSMINLAGETPLNANMYKLCHVHRNCTELKHFLIFSNIQFKTSAMPCDLCSICSPNQIAKISLTSILKKVSQINLLKMAGISLSNQ